MASYAGTSEQTIYIGGLIEKVTLGGVTSWKHYIAGANGTVAEYMRRSSGTTIETVYLLKDHLDSVDMVTNSSGAQMSRLSFDAWGKRRNGGSWSGNPAASAWTTITNTTRHGFTFHEMLDNVNLTHMNGRVYDQIIGRFLSPDPIVQAPGFTQSFNRYSYTFSNPLSYVDPSGYATADSHTTRTDCVSDCAPSAPSSGGQMWGGPFNGFPGTILWVTGSLEYTSPFDGFSPGGTVGGVASENSGSSGNPREIDNGPCGAQPCGAVDEINDGRCWNGEQGNFLDGLSGLLRQVGNDVSLLGAKWQSLQSPLNPFNELNEALAANMFGSNNTNIGIFFADLAPAAEILGTGGYSAAGRRVRLEA